eukprot:GILI01009009.1.p1 GENE.GILI01009009.1~~GILI01009009.1.p1  ORF type:complete len:261 (+),score=75.48 GILI01009009.1:30-812(+)
MNTITVRFVHRQSHTPVLELEGVEASATVGALRELLMERLASEEACMMRVFVKWHAEVEVGGRKRLIELTDEDAETSLSSMGISHLSEVHLDGPLTGDCTEGVGQALAVLGAHIQRMDNGQRRIATLLEKLVNFAEAQQSCNRLKHLPSEAYLARQALAADEGLAYGQLMVMERAEEGYQRLLTEASAGLFKKPSIEAHDLPIPFTIDRTKPHKTFTISDYSTTAAKVSNGDATLRASQSLTAAKHKFAVKIIVIQSQNR